MADFIDGSGATVTIEESPRDEDGPLAITCLPVGPPLIAPWCGLGAGADAGETLQAAMIYAAMCRLHLPEVRRRFGNGIGMTLPADRTMWRPHAHAAFEEAWSFALAFAWPREAILGRIRSEGSDGAFTRREGPFGPHWIRRAAFDSGVIARRTDSPVQSISDCIDVLRGQPPHGRDAAISLLRRLRARAAGGGVGVGGRGLDDMSILFEARVGPITFEPASLETLEERVLAADHPNVEMIRLLGVTCRFPWAEARWYDPSLKLVMPGNGLSAGRPPRGKAGHG